MSLEDLSQTSVRHSRDESINENGSYRYLSKRPATAPIDVSADKRQNRTDTDVHSVMIVRLSDLSEARSSAGLRQNCTGGRGIDWASIVSLFRRFCQ